MSTKMPVYYILNRPYLLRRWNNLSCGLVRQDNGICFSIPENMWTILECCDGSVDMQSVLMLPSQGKVFQELIQRKIISPLTPGKPFDPIPEPRILPFDYVRSIHWSITGCCNLRCKHCYMSAPKRKYRDLSMKEIKDFIRQMADAEIHRVSITGGEPLIRKDFWQIIESLQSAGIHVDQIFTNGLLVSPRFLQRAKEMNLSCEFVLSYDGKGTHDWLRGIEGTEVQTIEAIRRIKAFGYPVAIETALYNENLHTLLPTYELLKSLNIDFWKSSLIVDCGEWKQQHQARVPIQRQLYTAYDQVIEQSRQDGFPMGIQLDGYYACQRKTGNAHVPYREKGQGCYSCMTCITQPYLLPDGRLLPCPTFTDTPAAETMPFITDRTLSEIFQDVSGPFYQVTHIRPREIISRNQDCQDCVYRAQCGGGCRAMAQLSSGDVYGKDNTICSYFQNGYDDTGKRRISL